MKPLTDKQERFCQEYLKDLNGKQAAIRAGFSKSTAEQQASRMLTIVKVQERISELKNKRVKRTEITADRVLQELAKIGFSDIGQFINDDGTIKPLSSLKGKRRAVASIQVDEIQGDGWDKKTIKFKLHDKLSALDKIARHIGLYEKDNEQQRPTVSDTTPFKIKRKKK